MFYKYKERMNKLTTIANITDNNQKKTALEQFIEDEKKILSLLDVVTTRSQALESAISMLKAMSEPQMISELDITNI